MLDDAAAQMVPEASAATPVLDGILARRPAPVMVQRAAAAKPLLGGILAQQVPEAVAAQLGPLPPFDRGVGLEVG